MCIACKYCNEPERKQDKPGLICEACSCFVHLDCLRRPGTPGDFTCDVFFDFTCEDCSPSKKEVFTRNKFPWVNVILLTLHHLSKKSYGISHHGYFHYKTHICSFIDRNWHFLFGPYFKQKKNWVGTIAGALSVYSNLFFQSGLQALSESGWWKLMHNFSPAVAAHVVQEMAREKLRGRQRNQLALDKIIFLRKVIDMGYKDFINEQPPTAVVPVPIKKRKLDSNWDETNTSNASYYYDSIDSDSRAELLDDSHRDAAVSSHRTEPSYSDGETVFQVYTHSVPVPPSDSSSIHSYQQSAAYYDSDSRSGSPNIPQPPSDADEKPTTEPKKETKPIKTEEKPIIRESLFSTELNSVDLPWLEKKKDVSEPLVEMTPYEEVQLLKQVEGLIPKVKDPNKKAYLHVLKAKLALRRLKRHKHLPLFDFDKTVRLLAGHTIEDSNEMCNVEQVYDRFQRSYLLARLCGTEAAPARGVWLLPRAPPPRTRSPHSGLALRPYIRRDAHCRPLWLRLMDELLLTTNRHIKDYAPPPRGTVDYSYVQPQHIPAVNALCAQYFWPGIDLTEALQYPEFSCVVTYKRLVVGCAFLVPDVARVSSGTTGATTGTTEGYISFILTRPEWRRAHIAQFMLYHLLQTCSGKDVTLHVSPTNPAIFLYQKFGFKVEELIQDFYEKYYDIDYKGCRHALFLRLVR